MDIVVAGTAENIIMVEGGSREVSERDLIGVLEFAMGHIRRLVDIQRDLVAKVGKAKRALVQPVDTSELAAALDQQYRERLRQAIRIPGKEARQEEVDRIRQEAIDALKERFAEK